MSADNDVKKTESSESTESVEDSPVSEVDETAARKEAKALLKETRKLYKQIKKRVPEANRKEVEAAISGLSDVLGSEDKSCVSALEKLKKVKKNQIDIHKKSTAREIFESVLIAVIFAVILRTFLVEPFKIPTRSMVPTLLEGDQIFVTKLSYGVRLPFIDKYIVRFSDPQRGDVVVFAFPNEEAGVYLRRTNSPCMSLSSLSEEKDYIKRIVGVEGDTIEVIDQIVHVNGEPVSQQVIYERNTSDHPIPPEFHELWNHETLGDASYTTITHPLHRHDGPFKVEPGHVFVMGDNRDNSADSRCWGQVPVENIKGRAQIIWLSNGHFGQRWERLFTGIH